MHSILSPLLRRRAGRLHSRESFRTLVDLAAIKWVRDRGLDHAVEKERNLSPLLNLKNLVKSEPSKSLPLSIIATNSQALGLPIRPIDFVRKYQSVFEEFLPGGIGIHPHVKLTPETLGLDAEEQLIYQSEIHKQDSADRLLKLLMLTGIRKIPLPLIHRLQRDLGLPQDYAKTIVPEAPDYFRITGGSDPSLELVCWSSELAVSAMEKKATEGKLIEFHLQYSRGFEMDKKFKKWVDQWQKLPYISPYENALHLPAKSDEADKWAVAVLHEFLHLLVSKKTERENVLCFGECLGLRSRFKRALLQHPGIFYLSSKIGTHTVVLRDGYKRDLLIEKHPLMDMRYEYIHLMNTVKKDKKQQNVQGGSAQGKPSEDQVDKSEDEQDEELYGLSGSDVEHASDDEEEDEYESRSVRSRNAEGNRARIRRNSKYVAERSLRTSLATNLDRRYPSSRTRRTDPVEVSRRTVMRSETPKFSRTRGRSKTST
ncbi:protein WHAT'S THIS FACTOR 9, mitochondrial [Diospyros lotus]|uniref:protein WHAT'S THIS FACTOR 9, mitochondrial n=1 Tax=Diospyros lotus TaxID=55363 RepID=UPI0022528DB5|nr:protein WHAT'S THIS FACTOR 9, mitochondrial [Diospyros lotus]XP_052191212.1 protein WHAT'S THIS FACTOR 9, mitochondrial [Diospyros lotus]